MKHRRLGHQQHRSGLGRDSAAHNAQVFRSPTACRPLDPDHRRLFRPRPGGRRSPCPRWGRGSSSPVATKRGLRDQSPSWRRGHLASDSRAGRR
jgi:hypothetical protein